MNTIPFAYTVLARTKAMPTNARSVTNYKHDSQQSGTKGSLPPPRSLCRRSSAVKTSTHARTHVYDVYVYDTSVWLTSLRLGSYVPPYNSETSDKSDSPEILLTPAWTITRAGARKNNNRHKLSTEIALVLHDLKERESLVSNPCRDLADDFRRIQTRADTGATRRALMVSPRRTLWERVDCTYTRDFVRPRICPESALEVLEANPTDLSCDHAGALASILSQSH